MKTCCDIYGAIDAGFVEYVERECKDRLYGNTWTKEQILFMHKLRQCLYRTMTKSPVCVAMRKSIETIYNKHETRNVTFY